MIRKPRLKDLLRVSLLVGCITCQESSSVDDQSDASSETLDPDTSTIDANTESACNPVPDDESWTDAGADSGGGLSFDCEDLFPCSKGWNCDFCSDGDESVPYSCFLVNHCGNAAFCLTHEQACLIDCGFAPCGIHPSMPPMVGPDCISNRSCGGIMGLSCRKGEFCEYLVGECYWPDNMGKCVKIPAGCDEVWDPVCGCDGVTYGNSCEARAASTTLEHRGECLE